MKEITFEEIIKYDIITSSIREAIEFLKDFDQYKPDKSDQKAMEITRNVFDKQLVNLKNWKDKEIFYITKEGKRCSFSAEKSLAIIKCLISEITYRRNSMPNA